VHFPFREYIKSEPFALYSIEYTITIPDYIEYSDAFLSYYKRLVTSRDSYSIISTINIDNMTSSYNFYFALKHEVNENDVWGLSAGTERGLYIDYFDSEYGSPSWNPPKLERDNSHTFQFLMNRPVTSVVKKVPTVLDACLRIGGLVAFIKLFVSGLLEVNRCLFERELRKGIQADEERSGALNATEVETALVSKREDIPSAKDLYSYRTIKELYEG